jgi:hypothetical protein
MKLISIVAVIALDQFSTAVYLASIRDELDAVQSTA